MHRRVPPTPEEIALREAIKADPVWSRLKEILDDTRSSWLRTLIEYPNANDIDELGERYRKAKLEFDSYSRRRKLVQTIRTNSESIKQFCSSFLKKCLAKFHLLF